MENLTLEEIVLFRTLCQIVIGEREPLNRAERRHYIHGSNIIERLNKISLSVESFELHDLEKLKQSTRDEIIFNKASL